MKRLAALCLAALIAPSIASAQDADINTTFNLILANPSYSGCDDSQYDFDNDSPVCADLGTNPPGGFQAMFLIMSRQPTWLNGVGAAQFGLEHTGLVLGGGWSLCTGGAEIPQDAGGEWPASGTGNAVTWPGGCYVPAGETARIGFIPLAASDAGQIQVTGDPRLSDPAGRADYTNCGAVPFKVPMFNLAGAVLADGFVPICGAQGVPTREESWSSLKSLF